MSLVYQKLEGEIFWGPPKPIIGEGVGSGTHRLRALLGRPNGMESMDRRVAVEEV